MSAVGRRSVPPAGPDPGDAAGSGAATGTSPPTRTCDHGTDGPRNGGAASGGRGAVYGLGVQAGCTSIGRWAERRGPGGRGRIGGGSALPPASSVDRGCSGGGEGSGRGEGSGEGSGGCEGSGSSGSVAGDGAGHAGRAGGGCDATGGGVDGIAG
jgi:translation initiation factor IF-2